MKSRIFMYLFFFALMYVIFQFMNAKRYSETKEKEIAQLEEEINLLKIENLPVESISPKESDTRGFTLGTNPKAREYFEDQNMSPDSIARAIESKIIGQNLAQEDHPLVPYPGINGIMRINRVQTLNNRWILAEFTDGTYWGEALIAYFLDEKDELQFDTVDGVLYSK
ncbi:MAG TPA: hypothetical protein VK021_02245 [Flavobacteriaceae bacterium]|nr:hypothetical protein [Flavobacteriaceae bacterium]